MTKLQFWQILLISNTESARSAAALTILLLATRLLLSKVIVIVFSFSVAALEKQRCCDHSRNAPTMAAFGRFCVILFYVIGQKLSNITNKC